MKKVFATAKCSYRGTSIVKISQEDTKPDTVVYVMPVDGLKDMGSEMVVSVTLLLCLLNYAGKVHGFSHLIEIALKWTNGKRRTVSKHLEGRVRYVGWLQVWNILNI